MARNFLIHILILSSLLCFVSCTDDSIYKPRIITKKNDISSSAESSGVPAQITDTEQTATNITSGTDIFFSEEPMHDTKKNVYAELSIPETGKINIKSYTISTSFSGEKQISFTLDYTNYSQYNSDFLKFLSYTGVYQDGMRLEYGSSENDRNESVYLNPNETIEIITTFKLKNTTSDVVFECIYNDEICSRYLVSVK